MPAQFPQHGETFYVHECLWLVRSTGWFGLGHTVHPKQIPNTPAKFCGMEPKGQQIPTTNEKAIQWSSGYEIGLSTGIKGVNLKANFSGSAQTGYDANAEMLFTFKGAGFLCGTNKDPGHAALLVMRGTKS